MKIAIFYDYLDQKGGGERIILDLAQELNADIITTAHAKDRVKGLGFENNRIITLKTFYQDGGLKHASSILAFATCDFSKDYDFFICAGFWSVFAAKKHKPNMYYALDVLKGFYEKEESMLGKNFFERRLKPPRDILIKILFERSFNNFNRIISISKFNQKQVLDYYKQDSNFIYPPIRCENYSYKKSKGFWISVNRLHSQKRIELQIESFRLMPDKKLFVIGDYPERDSIEKYVAHIKNTKPKNVEIITKASYDELKDYYSNCEGMLATSKNEAFGMAVVEAMASGKPIVATNEGGFQESIVDGVTGFLVNPDVQEIVEAVRKVSKNPGKFKDASIKRSKQFDSKIFFQKFRENINYVLSTLHK